MPIRLQHLILPPVPIKYQHLKQAPVRHKHLAETGFTWRGVFLHSGWAPDSSVPKIMQQLLSFLDYWLKVVRVCNICLMKLKFYEWLWIFSFLRITKAFHIHWKTTPTFGDIADLKRPIYIDSKSKNKTVWWIELKLILQKTLHFSIEETKKKRLNFHL